jgi:para-aminobenzoate synthetase component 1
MEIIDELEPTPRGVYCGAIGYIGYDGAMDTSIAIRTATVVGGDIEYRAGGGLVWDSDVWEEFAETEAKALAFRSLADALG